MVTRVSITQKAARSDDSADEGADDHGVRPAHGVAAVGLDAVGDSDEHRDQSEGEGHRAPPVDASCRLTPRSSSFRYAQSVPATPKGTETRNTSRQSTGAEQAPDDEPEKRPRDRGDVVDPEGEPALIGGKASVRMAAEFAMSIAAAEALHDAHHDQVGGSGAARASSRQRAGSIRA